MFDIIGVIPLFFNVYSFPKLVGGRQMHGSPPPPAGAHRNKPNPEWRTS
jgi:hypothetical protein